MALRATLGQLSYAGGCAFAVIVVAIGLHTLLLSVGNPVGPALLFGLAAIAAWLTGRAMRFMLLPRV